MSQNLGLLGTPVLNFELSVLGNENTYQIFQTDGGFDPTFMPEQTGNGVTPINEFSNPDGPPQGAGVIVNP